MSHLTSASYLTISYKRSKMNNSKSSSKFDSQRRLSQLSQQKETKIHQARKINERRRRDRNQDNLNKNRSSYFRKVYL